MKNNESVNLKNQLQNDNVFVKSDLINLASLTELSTRKGSEKVIISENQIANVVSNSYGHYFNFNAAKRIQVLPSIHDWCWI